MKRVLLLSFTFLSLYAFTLGIFKLLRIDEGADRISTAIAKELVEAFTDRKVATSFDEGTIWFQVRKFDKRPASEEEAAKVRAEYAKQGKKVGRVVKPTMIVNDIQIKSANVNTTIPMFLAVIIALARRRDWRFAVVLAAGTVALITLDGFSLAAMVWGDPANRIAPTAAFHAMKMLSVWTEGGWLMAPIFIGALVALTWLRDPESPGLQLPFSRLPKPAQKVAPSVSVKDSKTPS